MLAKFDLKSPCIFVADISDISYEIMKYAYEISDDIRRKKIISFSRDDDKKRCAMAGLLVFWIMNCVLNFESDKVIYYEDSGKLQMSIYCYFRLYIGFMMVILLLN